MNPRTYFDLDPRERGSLSEDDVRRYVDLSLMMQGILRPEEPKLLDETVPPLPTRTVYVIDAPSEYGSDSPLDVVFDNVEDAEDFVRNVIGRRVNDYRIRGDYLVPLTTSDCKIKSVQIPRQSDVAAMRSAIEKSNTAKEANRKAREDYHKAVEVCDQASADIWDDYRERQRQAQRTEEVRATFDRYLAMSEGNEAVARTFLEKAYPPEWSEVDREDIDYVDLALGNRGRVAEHDPA